MILSIVSFKSIFLCSQVTFGRSEKNFFAFSTIALSVFVIVGATFSFFLAIRYAILHMFWSSSSNNFFKELCLVFFIAFARLCFYSLYTNFSLSSVSSCMSSPLFLILVVFLLPLTHSLLVSATSSVHQYMDLLS